MDWVCGVGGYAPEKGRWRLWDEEVDGKWVKGRSVCLIGWFVWWSEGLKGK